MGFGGRLTPVREDSLNCIQQQRTRLHGQSAFGKPVQDEAAAAAEATSILQSTRTGPSNDHPTFPAIRSPKKQQQQQQHRNKSPIQSNKSSPEPGQQYSPSTSPQSYIAGNLQRQSLLQQQQQHDHFLQPAGCQHKTVPAHALLDSDLNLNPSIGSAQPGGGAGFDQHVLASRALHGSDNSRASPSSRRASSASWSSSRPRTQQHRDAAADEQSFNAQEQLQQLYGHSSSCSPELEAATAARILALPYAICTAADGSLFEVATGHVQVMMLRRQLARRGVELTDEEAAMLTSEADTTSQRSLPMRPLMRLTEGGDHTAGSSLSGAAGGTPPEGAKRPGFRSSNADSNSIFRGSNTNSEDRVALRSRLRKSCAGDGSRNNDTGGGAAGPAAGRRGSAVGSVRRKSALGAVMEAAGEGAVDSQEQLPLDDVVLSHLSQLDLFVESLKQQLAHQSAAAKAAKAEAAAAAAAVAAGCARGSDRRSRHVTPRSHYIQQQQQQAASQGSGVEGGEGQDGGQQGSRNWSAARGLVMMNIQNWQKQRVRTSRMQNTPMKAPTWEDVILLGDVYIKRRAGQGAAVYEARCAELGLTPCTQVLQQLDSSYANMAHCNVGAGTAPALAAALAANNAISSLDLRDNNLNGKAVSQILKGLVTATAARLPRTVKQRNISFAHQSVAAIGANRQADGLPVARNIPSYAPDLQLPSHGNPALLGGLSAGGNSTKQQQQQSAASSAIKKVKSLCVRWGGNSSHGGDWDSSGGEADAASSSPSRGPTGYRTMPTSPRQDAEEASPFAWDDGRDWAAHEQQQLQQHRLLLMTGSEAAQSAGRFSSAAGSQHAQYQGGQAGSTMGRASLESGQDGPGPGPGPDAFFLPSPTARKLGDQSAAAAAAADSRAGSSGGGAGEAATADAHMALSSLAGAGASVVSFVSASGGRSGSGWGARGALSQAGGGPGTLSHLTSKSAAEEEAQRDLELQEDGCEGVAVGLGSPTSPVQQQRQQRAGGACSSICEPTIYSGMSELNLSGNPLGLAGAKAVAQLLDPSINPSQFLVKLNLSKCNLGEAGGLAIASSLRAGNLELRVLLLMHNNLGNKTAAAFGDLLESSHTLKELDLSWNQIKAEGARALARGLAANATLSKLSLAWNGLEEGASAMGDMLAANMGLKHLDLSHCRVGAESCMMLGEGLKGNVMLEVLLLSGNDRIGEDGARHLMIALAANRGLQFLGLNGSNMTSAVHEAGGGASEFNPANPDGSYSLDLAVAADRVVAVQLVELDRAAEKELLRGITVDGKIIPSARKANWPSLLPNRGMLSCTFNSASVRKAMGVMEGSKLTTLLKQLRLSSMSDRERLEMVAMFAPFALFTCKQISSVTQTFSIGAERVAAAALLFTRAADTSTDLAALTSVMSQYDLLGWKDVLGWYSSYKWNVPTGHYELDLSLPVHTAIAARLRDESNDSPDGPTWMNLLYDCATTCMKKPQSHGPPDEWKAGIPTRGSVSVDYVSTHPPGSKAQHTTWGLPPLSTTATGSGARSRTASISGARSSTNGAAKTSVTGAARPSANGAAAAAAAGGQAGGRPSGTGSAAAATAEQVLKPISDQQLEVMIRDQLRLRGPTATVAAAAADAAGTSTANAGTDAAPADTNISSASGSGGGSSGSAAAGSALTVASGDTAVVALRQAIAAGLLLLSAQVRQLVEAFTSSPHRVEAAVICWAVTLDRFDNYWTVLYCLQGIEQSNLLQRLGPSRLFNPAHASAHWVLDLSHPAHIEVAKKLVSLASSGGNGKDKNDESSLQNWWNLRLGGVLKQVNENGNNMWGMLTAETCQPILEFDFLGPDSWAALGKSDAEVATLPAGDKKDLRERQAARLEAVRMKQLYSYSCDGTDFPRAPWATYQSLMSPQLMKSPWAAAWDRLVRVLLRLDIRTGAISKHTSALRQAFEAAAASKQVSVVRQPNPIPPPAAAGTAGTAGEEVSADTGQEAVGGSSCNSAGSQQQQQQQQQQQGAAAEEGTPAAAGVSAAAAAAAAASDSEEDGEEQLCITAQEFEGLLKSWGYNKTEVFHYLKLMEALLQAEHDAKQAAAKAACTQGAAAAAGTSTGQDPAAAAAAAGTGAAVAGSSAAQPALKSSNAPAAAAGGGGGGGGGGDGATAAAKTRPTGLPGAAAVAAKGKAGFAAAASAVKRGLQVQAAFGGGKGKAGARVGSDGGGATRSSGDGAAAPSLAAQLETRFDRGLSFPEFVHIVMTEPPKAIKLKDVVTLATLMGGSALKGKLKAAAAAAAAVAAAVAATPAAALATAAAAAAAAAAAGEGTHGTVFPEQEQ